MSERLCCVNGVFGYFQCWEFYADVISPSPMIGGTPGGQISRVYGIVEFSDRVQRVDPSAIHFIDEKNLSLYSLANNTIKENPVEIIVFLLTIPNEKRIFINSLKKSLKGRAKNINYLTLKNRDISGVSIDGVCNLYFYSDEESVKGLTPDYVLSKNYVVSNYLHQRGAAILLSFDDLIKIVIEKLEEKRK